MTETVQAKGQVFMVEKWLKPQPTLMTSLFTSSVGTEICSWLSKDDVSPICIDEIWCKMDPPEKKLLPYLTSISCYESCCNTLDIASFNLYITRRRKMNVTKWQWRECLGWLESFVTIRQKTSSHCCVWWGSHHISRQPRLISPCHQSRLNSC